MELRRIFYGYRKDQFDYYIVQEEALVVNKIFRDYLAGHTLLEIAKELTAKEISYYKDKTQWTKNMVCRIIENEHYCGDDEYPRIIDRETFDKAVKQKAEKGGVREKDTEEIAYLKATTICETCGKHFTRKSKYKVRERWLCSGGCPATTKYLDDPLLYSRIKTVMNAVRNQPYLIMLPKGESTYVPSKDIRLKERQIKYLITQPNSMFHPIMKLIYETVTEKFSEMELDLSAAVSDALYDLFSEYEPEDEQALDIPFMKKTVSAIIIQLDGNIRIRFVNGKEIGNEEVCGNG